MTAAPYLSFQEAGRHLKYGLVKTEEDFFVLKHVTAVVKLNAY